jgi:hypothetical protein
MSGTGNRCAHIARTNAPRIICQAWRDASVSGTPDLHFRTVTDVIESARHGMKSTANADFH